MKLHLGVADFPYAEGAETTGDVAEKLEKRYHIMERFSYAHQDFIAKQLEEGVRDALEALIIRGAPPQNLFAGACSEIEERFRLFLDMRELDAAGDPGIPTKASLRGVNHRLKRPYAKTNPPRPSFIDTGHFQSSFKAWTEE